MYDNRLVGLEQAMQIGHRRIEREKIIELKRRDFAIERQGVVAAQCDPVRIADRRNSSEAIKRAAQHDGQKARVAAFGARELWQIGPRKQRAGG